MGDKLVDLISRSALIEELKAQRGIKYTRVYNIINTAIDKGIEIAIRSIEAAPAVDAVEVVRCGECEKRETTECALSYFVFDDFDVEVRFLDVPDDFYCPYGERRDT